MLKTVSQWVQGNKNLLQNYLLGQELNASSSKKKDLLKINEHEYPSFSKLLPYQYFDKESHLFINQHNAGLLYRVTPLTGANEKIAEQLDSILRNKISDDFNLQLILVKHNQIGLALDAFAAQFCQNDFVNLNLLGQSLKDFYAKAAVDGFNTHAAIAPRLTHTECFIVVDKAKSESEQALKEGFSQFKISFEASLTAAKLGFKLAEVGDLLSLLSLYLNHDPDSIYPQEPQYNPKTLIKHQVLSRDFDLDIHKEGLNLRGVNAKNKDFKTAVSVLTIDALPAEFHLWSNINNASNVFYPEQSISCDYIISVSYKLDNLARAQGRANRKTRSLDKKAKSDYALHVAGTEEQSRAWRQFRDDLVSQKTRACKMLYNLVLFSRPHQAARDVEAARSSYAYNGIKLALCKRMQLPYFLTSLPFLFSGNLEENFKLPTLMWPISSWNAVQYMPLLSDWSGTDKGILLPTMREQFACIDPFSGVFGTNYNIAVTGTSGGGKSFFIQMLMLNVLFNGGDIFVIDVGGSYRKLCEVLGGVYLEYSNLAMNPFTHVENILQELDDIIALFELLSCPRNGASDDDRGTLREAILTAFEQKGRQTRIDEVKDCLLALYENDKETYPSAKILSKNLEPYCSQAEHGKAFNEPSELSPTARIIVVDLKEIENNLSIRAPVLLSVLSQYQRRMFNSDRSRQKMCVIDEAWSFFTGDAIAANFITKGFRTGRRHKASFVTITQGIEDYYEFSEARAAWENSALKLIFLQEQAALMEHQKQHQTFSDYELALLKAFPKARDAGFSQVLVRANGLSSFHRLFVDPFTQVLLSSDGDDYQAVQNYVAQGLSFLEAVAKVANKQGKKDAL